MVRSSRRQRQRTKQLENRCTHTYSTVQYTHRERMHTYPHGMPVDHCTIRTARWRVVGRTSRGHRSVASLNASSRGWSVPVSPVPGVLRDVSPPPLPQKFIYLDPLCPRLYVRYVSCVCHPDVFFYLFLSPFPLPFPFPSL